MALRAEIVDFGRLRFLNQADQVGGVGEVAVMQEEVRLSEMRVFIEMIDALGIERRRAALDAVYDVSLGQQEFRKIGPVLTGDADDQCNLSESSVSPAAQVNDSNVS